MEKRGYVKPYVLMVISIIVLIFIWSNPLYVFAGGDETERYVWISVDAVDDNSGLTYALDTMDPDAFGSTNEFKVLEGSSHTIYVKDVAGNISSQQYSAITVDRNDDTDKGDINLNIEVGDKTPTEYVPGTFGTGTGTGTLTEETQTDGSLDSDKVFYTVEAQDGNVFYLVVDHTDSEDNVYFLDQVRLNDLQSLATEGGQTLNSNSSDNDGNESLLSQLGDDKVKTIEEATSGSSSSGQTRSGGGRTGGIIFILVIAAIAYGAYYYIKVYSKKKDEALDLQDAHDMDDFEGDYGYDDIDRYEYDEDEDDDDDFPIESVQSIDEMEAVQDSIAAEVVERESTEQVSTRSYNTDNNVDYVVSDSVSSDKEAVVEDNKETPSSSGGFSFNNNGSTSSDTEEYNKFDDEDDDE